jgi:hypothetical protein
MANQVQEQNVLNSSDDEYYEDYEGPLGKCAKFINNSSAVRIGTNTVAKQESMKEQAKAKQMKIQQNKKKKEEERLMQAKHKEKEDKKTDSALIKTPVIKAEREVVDDWEDFM